MALKLGKVDLAKIAPNHPFAHSQISFGVKLPASSNKRIQGAEGGSILQRSGPTGTRGGLDPERLITS